MVTRDAVDTVVAIVTVLVVVTMFSVTIVFALDSVTTFVEMVPLFALATEAAVFTRADEITGFC